MKTDQRTLIPTVTPIGNTNFPRWVIVNQFNEYWTGDSWSEEESERQIYAKSNDACTEYQRLLTEAYGEMPVRRFEVKFSLDLFKHKDVSEDQVKEWLHKICRVNMDTNTHGIGPVEDSLGLVSIDWSLLKEKK